MDWNKRILMPSDSGMVRLLLVGLLSLVGCGRGEEDFQTFSHADADRVDAARQAAQIADSAPPVTDTAPKEPAPTAMAQIAARRAASQVLDDETASGTTPANIDPTDVEPAAEELAAERPQSGRTAEMDAIIAAFGGSSDAAQNLLAARGGQLAAAQVTNEPVVREIRLLIPERSFTVEGPGDALRVSYDDFDLLKVLNMEPVPPEAVQHFPKWLADLDGRRVRVRGFMYPTFLESGLRAFVLARDNQICCFGRNPKIYDLVEVTLADGETSDYIQGRPFDVVGTFHIRPEADGDELWQLYQIDDAQVIDD